MMYACPLYNSNILVIGYIYSTCMMYVSFIEKVITHITCILLIIFISDTVKELTGNVVFKIEFENKYITSVIRKIDQVTFCPKIRFDTPGEIYTTYMYITQSPTAYLQH